MSIFAMTRRRPQTWPEEIANSASHALGVIAVMWAAPSLIARAIRQGKPHISQGVSVFAVTLALLYLLSAVYHALPRNELKRVFQKLDQAAIFLSIAGSYTPFALGLLQTAWDWAIFDAVWGLALLGIVFRSFQGFRGTHLTTVLYVLLSLLALLALVPFLRQVPLDGLLLFAAGLVSYAIGIFFFTAHSLPFRHFLWHLFSLLGSTCHFLVLFWYVC